MKKLIIIALVLLAAIPAFAADNQIGITATPRWQWGGDSSLMDMLITVDGANYFDDGSGIEYGAGLSMRLMSNGVKPEQIPLGAAFRVGYGYRYEFNPLVGFVLGVGLDGSTLSAGGYTVLTLGMYGKIGFDFTLMDALRFNVGAALGGPFLAGMFGGESYVGFATGFYVAPSVGIAFAY